MTDNVDDIKRALVKRLHEVYSATGMTQQQFADAVFIHQPRISDIIHVRIDRFTIDYLLGILNRCGYIGEVRLRGRRRKL